MKKKPKMSDMCTPKVHSVTEGLEASARGFGAKTEKHTNLSCFNKRGASSHKLDDGLKK